MKHLLATLLLLVPTLHLAAQKGLHINEVFEGKVIPREALQESYIKGEGLQQYKLKVLRTAKFTATSQQRDDVEARFEADTKTLLSDSGENRELERLGGHLYYAIVQIADTPRGQHLYLCYQCHQGQGTYHITLAYIEGKASLADLRKTFKKK